MLVYLLRSQSSHILCQNDVKFQINPPTIFLFKMLNLRKIDVYNVRNFIEAFLSFTQVHKLVHKQIYYIASSAHITSIHFLVPTLAHHK